jgi:hypothetical protein
MATGRQPHRRNIRGHQAGNSARDVSALSLSQGRNRSDYIPLTPTQRKVGDELLATLIPGGRARPVIKMTAQVAKPAAKAARPVLKTVVSAARAATAKNPRGGVGARRIQVNDRRADSGFRTVDMGGGRTAQLPSQRSRGPFAVPQGMTVRLGPNVTVRPRPTSSGRTATTGRRPAPTQPAPAAQRQRPIIKMNAVKKAPAQERPRLKTQIPDWMK